MRLNRLVLGIGRAPGIGRLGALPPAPTASAIAGLIIAALILMTPNELFEAAVTALGIPNLIPAATPPLGANARIFTALILALAVGLAAWIVLSMYLGRTGRGDGSLPRYRRADMHPDAPLRRPLFASDDLGEPLELTEALPAAALVADPIDDEALSDERAMARLSRFIARGEPEAAPEAQAEIIVDDIAEDGAEDISREDGAREDGAREDGWPGMEQYFAAAREAEAEAEETNTGFITDGAVPDAHDGRGDGESPEEIEDHEEIRDQDEIQAAPSPPGPVFTIPLPRRDEAESFEPAIARPAPPPAREPTPLDGDTRETLARLVDRLELGIKRRREQARPDAGSAPLALRKAQDDWGMAPQSGASDHDMDGALREALEALEKLSARGG